MGCWRSLVVVCLISRDWHDDMEIKKWDVGGHWSLSALSQDAGLRTWRLKDGTAEVVRIAY